MTKKFCKMAQANEIKNFLENSLDTKKRNCQRNKEKLIGNCSTIVSLSFTLSLSIYLSLSCRHPLTRSCPRAPLVPWSAINHFIPASRSQSETIPTFYVETSNGTSDGLWRKSVGRLVKTADIHDGLSTKIRATSFEHWVVQREKSYRVNTL
jgi:hypothetical protein